MIYENIRNLREDHDKTQKELADYLNIMQTTYSKYELGKINIPVEVFIKLADFYNVSVDYLLGRTKINSNWQQSIKRKKIAIPEHTLYKCNPDMAIVVSEILKSVHNP